MRHVTTSEYGTEVVLQVPNGMQLVADGEHEVGTDYVRVCDPAGVEVAYWVADEWQEEPAAVMGAIVGALCAVSVGDPERGGQIPAAGGVEPGEPRYWVIDNPLRDELCLPEPASARGGDGPYVLPIVDEVYGGVIAWANTLEQAERIAAALAAVSEPQVDSDDREGWASDAERNAGTFLEGGGTDGV